MATSGNRAGGGLAARAGHGERLGIGILAEPRYLTQAQPMGLRDALAAAGHAVRLVDVDAAAGDPEDLGWLGGLDLVVVRGRSPAVLTLLARAEWHGLATLNRHASIGAVHDKAVMGVLLQLAAIPSPATRVGAPTVLARTIPASRYPLVVKPIFGDNGRGLRLVRTPAALARVGRRAEEDGPVLAQAFVPSDGWDLKLYGIGQELFAVRKPSPLYEWRARADAQPVPLTPALIGLGRRCRALFGLELFGVDCLETPEGPVVIEVNDFPNYTGVDGASEQLAAYVAGSALRARGLR